jgi:protein phosphatase
MGFGAQNKLASLSIDLYGLTDRGPARDRNEDRLLIIDLEGRTRVGSGEAARWQVKPRGVLIGVFDGMGGAAAGEVASDMARTVFDRELARRAVGDPAQAAEVLGEVFYLANSEIRGRATADQACRGMGTTATVCVITATSLVFGQVGDSRAYVLREGRLVQVTKDQSLVEELAAHGESAADLADYKGFFAGVILQALGAANDTVPTFGRVALRGGDLVLLCTDGLTAAVSDDQLGELLQKQDSSRELAPLAARLVAAAAAAGGDDNVTVVLARVDELATLRQAAGAETVRSDVTVAHLVLRVDRRNRLKRRSKQGLLLLLVVLVMFAAAGMIVWLGR